MGSYINIGLICGKENFIEKAVKLIGFLNEFHFKKVDYSVDEKYSDWVESKLEQCGIGAAVEHCIKDSMAKITGDFILGGYTIKDALFQVESLADNTNCFLIMMPEQQNQIFRDINMAEEIIISFFKEISQLGFRKGFCDSEAEAEDEHGYAISVDYNPFANIALQSWKIDGLTSRVQERYE